ncbi:hypothetical protein [Deinococcus pimensis]|uniref:hypothetical protein n=1 Tax=Deinococcus pimensis TaxID=309888 RepID=UPI000489E8F9|nr:hypothetical protein [Deinococcus pimensis]
MRQGSPERYARDLLELFEGPRAELRRFAHTEAFLGLARREEAPAVRELVVLVLRHVKSAEVLPLSFLVEELQTMLDDARQGFPKENPAVRRLRNEAH